MKFYREDVFRNILQLTKENGNTNPSINSLTNKITEVYGIADSVNLRKIMKYEMKQYKRNRKSYDGSVVLLDCDDDEWNRENIVPSTSKKHPDARKKSFANMSSKHQRNISDNILKTISMFVDAELNEGVERKINITQFLGYLIHRINYMSDKKIAEIGKNIFCGERKEEKLFLMKMKPLH